MTRPTYMRLLRVALASLSLVAMTLLLALPTLAICSYLGWLPRAQLIPAVMAVEIPAIAAIAVSVAVCGRLYCSVLCPLGIAQDLARWIFSLVRLRRDRPMRTSRRIRFVLFGAFVCAAVLGFTGLIAPYGIFARFVTVGVVHAGEPSAALVVWAVALFAFVVGMTAFGARWWCNQVCPVGTLLGWFSRFAFFRPRIDREKCAKCGLCATTCDTGAIVVGNDRSVAIDHSLCVTCLNCKGSCRKGALNWR